MNEMVLLSQTDDESVEQKAKYIDDLLSEEEIVKKAEEIRYSWRQKLIVYWGMILMLL